MSWGIRELTPADRLEILRRNEPAATASEHDIVAIERRLDELRAQWRALLPKGTIELTF